MLIHPIAVFVAVLAAMLTMIGLSERHMSIAERFGLIILVLITAIAAAVATTPI